MENLFDKKLKIIVTINFCLLAVFLLAQSFSTFADISLKKKMANKTFSGALDSDRITFSATAFVEVKPDVANFAITVREEANDTAAAQQKMTDKSNKALDLLAKKSIDKNDIQTNSYDTHPKYSCEPAKPTIIGYEAAQVISFKVNDVSKSGDIVTELAALGISDVKGPNFSIGDTSEYEEKARSEAIKEAKEKAQKIAKELGVTLGKIVSFSDNSSPYTPYMGVARGFSVRSPNMEAGEQKVSATVSITYEIR